MHPKHLLSRYGITPKQSLGQNFIDDDNVLSHIVAVADLSKEDHVLEIGPGLGALTKLLAKGAGQVTAVEIDDRLFPILSDELEEYENIELVRSDILDWNPEMHLDRPYKVVANIPYYITGLIVRKLLTTRRKPELMVLTVQDEVANRMAARPGQMSLLAVSVQFYADISIEFGIKAGSFWPRPDVDSAVVRLDIAGRSPLKQEQEEEFFKVVRVGFSQKRKQLQKNLRALGYSRLQISEALEKASIEGSRRAETLSIEEWVTLYRNLS